MTRIEGVEPIAAAPLVSVVVVAYNNWPDLELAIHSAICQSYTPLEVIVVDNSSSDATPDELPKRFGDRIRYLRQPNTGDAGAYNTGFRHARGDFVQFLDGDDVLAPNKIDKQMEVFRVDPGADIVYGEIRHFQSLPCGTSLFDRKRRPYDDMIAATLPPDWQGVDSPLAALFSRRALDRIGPWDGTVYVTDLDYWLRAAWLGCTFRMCRGIVAFSRLHPGQMSADRPAVRCGTEAVLLKALTYIDCEPHRTLVQTYLAQIQYQSAKLNENMTKPAALAKLWEAHRTQSREITITKCFLAAAEIAVPGGRWIARLPGVLFLGRLMVRLAARLGTG